MKWDTLNLQKSVDKLFKIVIFYTFLFYFNLFIYLSLNFLNCKFLFFGGFLSVKSYYFRSRLHNITKMSDKANFFLPMPHDTVRNETAGKYKLFLL